jgi:eukaryotic-like serine/threonine-protein kinase
MSASPATPGFDLWGNLTSEEAGLLNGRVTDERLAAGTSFIREGETGDSVYLIRDGEVSVRRGGVEIARVRNGQIVGEMALMNREPRNADAVAFTNCTVSRLAAADFDELCRRLPSLKLILTRLVAHRLNWSGQNVLARRIGPYEIVKQLGAGGMGWVFRARRGGDEFAVKMLPHPLVQQPGFLERYRREAEVLQQVSHPSIVRLYDMIELHGTLFLVLEYIEGGNGVEWLIQRGVPDVADVRTVTVAVARALQAAHARGVVHRDVKPDNIMITTAGEVKLVDFGIAGTLDGPVVGHQYEFTPAYAAPERFAGDRGRPESDFYSLGATIYEFATGHLPFLSDDVPGWARAHQEQIAPTLRTPSPEMASFVCAALIKDPRRRRVAIQPFLESWANEPPGIVRRPPALRIPLGTPISPSRAAAQTI